MQTPPPPPLSVTATLGRKSSRHLEEQILGGEVVHQADVVLIHHSQLPTATAKVKAAYGGVLLQQQDGERVVRKDLHDLWREA